MSLIDALASIQLGFANFTCSNKSIFSDATKDAALFFSHDTDYKRQFSKPGIKEWGYSDLSYKESFAIRDQAVPLALQNCIPAYHALHHLALQCLQIIAEKMQWPFEKLQRLTQKSDLYLQNPTASLLRVIHYQNKNTKDHACVAHQDLGLISIVISTNSPALEILDYTNYEWLDIESIVPTFDAIIMVGETLSSLSNGKLLPATHRVRTPENLRTSLVFQLRADPDVLIDSTEFENTVTKKFHKPFCLTGQEFYLSEIKNRTSVNGSY